MIVQARDYKEIPRFENPRYNPDHQVGKTFIVNGDDK